MICPETKILSTIAALTASLAALAARQDLEAQFLEGASHRRHRHLESRA
jgi:Ni/Co efflux regulator RcnB